jgi:ADP-Ribosyltransferase in polyvalent proteins
MEGMLMIVYHGSIRKFEHFNKETVVQSLSNDINTIGFWFTSDINSAKPYAIGTESVIQKSETEFWEDGEPKVVQFDRPVSGFIYKVYIDEPNLKEYESNSEDSYDLFMRERDKYCDYFGAKKRKPIWKDKAILLNKEEANAEFRKNLISQGYEGFLIRNTKLHIGITNLYCIFSENSLQIADVMPIDGLDE